MKSDEINIRDPFVLEENGIFYLYGTRADNFGVNTGGFDVYTSRDLNEWSLPKECFRSDLHGLNHGVNWAPEVHKYKGAYYMLATFTKENNLRGTYALKSDCPVGPFKPHSHGTLTPFEWEALDGTLYVDKSGQPYLVFCHEHTQICDGTICCVKLSDDLTEAQGEVTTLFHGSSPFYVPKKKDGEHYVTDGPFMYENKKGELLMIWSTIVNSQYYQCIAKSAQGNICGPFEHLEPIITNDGGHGMIFKNGNKLMLTFHYPNKSGFEHPVFKEIEDNGKTLAFK